MTRKPAHLKLYLSSCLLAQLSQSQNLPVCLRLSVSVYLFVSVYSWLSCPVYLRQVLYFRLPALRQEVAFLYVSTTAGTRYALGYWIASTCRDVDTCRNSMHCMVSRSEQLTFADTSHSNSWRPMLVCNCTSNASHCLHAKT